MNTSTKERLIARISWGHIPIMTTSSNGEIKSFILHPPTSKEQSKAAFVYSVEYQRAISIGLPSEKELLDNLIELKIWSLEEEEQIKGVQKDIKTIRKGLLSLVYNRKKLEKARSLLRNAENVFIRLLNRKHILLQNSADAHAEICRQRYLIGQITETEDGEKFWKTQQEFDDYADNSLIEQLANAFFNSMRIPSSTVRELARSSQWRPYWEVAKKCNDLFNNEVASWSFDQKELSYWSTIYDSVYSAFERPAADIIDDDDLLDSWFILQEEKTETKNQKIDNRSPSKPGRNEEFIMTDEDGSKRVYKMNDPANRAKIKAREKLIAMKGSVNEQEMPDSQLEMRQQFVERQRKHVKSINTK